MLEWLHNSSKIKNSDTGFNITLLKYIINFSPTMNRLNISKRLCSWQIMSLNKLFGVCSNKLLLWIRLKTTEIKLVHFSLGVYKKAQCAAKNVGNNVPNNLKNLN
jgi:hypothetical protein